MDFIVKKGIDLTKYGFEQRSDGCWYWWRKEKYIGALNMYIVDNRVVIPSASKDSIATLCQMYKNGDLEIMSNDTFVTMKLTQDEIELIKNRRKSNETKNN